MNPSDLRIELPYVKLPYDVSVKNFKCTRKLVEKEMQSVLNSIINMRKQGIHIQKSETNETISSLIVRLKSLKRKLNDDYTQQDQVYESCKKRIQYLNEVSKNPDQSLEIQDIGNQQQLKQNEQLEKQQINEEIKNAAQQIQLKQQQQKLKSQVISQEQYHINRLRRMIIDYLIREGHTKTAQKMMEIYKLQPFLEIDSEVIQERNEIIKDLKKKSVIKALEWCVTNKSKLIKLDSNLEFRLFFQQYLQLIKNNKSREAIEYLKKNSEQFKDKYQTELEKASILLLIKPENLNLYPRYKQYVDNEQVWEDLINLFKHDIYNVFSVTSQSLLNLSLSTGLSCLKTLSCYNQKFQKLEKCPVCQEEMQQISSELPSTHKFVSSLICRISGEMMDQNNPPILLPNGQVYGNNALQKMVKQNNGNIKCPETGEIFDKRSTTRIFLA